MMMMMTIPTHRIQIPDRLYFRIGDVADLLGIKPYVLRYWESEFTLIQPQKSPSGQRVYRRKDVEILFMIKHLLYEERYSIEGAKKRMKELRKEGDLSFRPSSLLIQSTEFPILSSSPLSHEKRQEVRQLIEELKSIIDTPIGEIFRF